MKTPPDNPILSLVQTAKPVNTEGKPDKWANRRAGNYLISDGRMYFMRQGRDSKKSENDATPQINEIPTALTDNFIALIAEQIVLDDGAKQDTAFFLEGKQKNGALLPPLTISALQYQTMQWPLRHWGARAIVEADQATPRRLANAILKLSGDIPLTTVYQHTGWRKIDDAWRYLSASGAIGEDGLNPDIRIELGEGHLQRYALPAPADNPRQIAGALFRLLDIAPQNRAVGVSLFCGVIRAALGECLPIDFSLFLLGQTGSQKSECAALALGCFGDFNARTFPANFTDTENDLEHKAHQAKDAVFVVDDFAPSVNQQEANKLHSKAERLFRSVGNQAGRGRRNADMTGKPAYFPRGLLIATGEDIPKGASLLGRLLIIELRRGDVDLSLLSDFQRRARNGELVGIMAAFSQWLAPRIAELKRSFPEKVRDIRDAVQGRFPQSHPRAPDIYAPLYAAAEVYIEFAQSVDAIGATSAGELIDKIDETLKIVVLEQKQYQKNADEVERFIALLRAAFSAGECHVSDHLKQGPPELLPFVWGWRKPNEDAAVVGYGQLIGWVNQSKGELWLEPEAVFKVVQRFASAQNDPMLMQKATLWKRLLDRGLLADCELSQQTGAKRADVKRTAAGTRHRVLVFDAKLITDTGNN